MRVTVLDAEWTFQVTQEGKLDGSPYNPINRLISVGYITDISTGDGPQISGSDYRFTFHSDNRYRDFLLDISELQQVLDNTDLLVGHNLKSDLAWLFEIGLTYNGALWDTMIGEYILCRGRKWALDLATCCERRGTSLKKVDITADYLSNKLSYENIPLDDLIEYGKQDIQSTWELFLKQWELYEQEHNKCLKPTLQMMNEMCLVLTHMERNGICIDRDEVLRVRKEYLDEKQKLEQRLQEIVATVMGDTPINLASTDQLSQLVYSRKVLDKAEWAETFNIGVEKRGAVLKPKRRPRMGKAEFVAAVKSGTERVYKTKASQCQTCLGSGKVTKVKTNGEPFSKAHACKSCSGSGIVYQVLPQVAGLCCVPASVHWVAQAGFSTDKEHLEELAKVTGSALAKEFLTGMVRLNKIETYLSTFVDGILKNIRDNGILHTWFNQCVTATGRLSSSGPNFQNLPREHTLPIRRAIVSRFEGGAILDGDYAQLEFRVAAFLAQCKAAMQDILDKVDVHSFTSNTLTEAGQPTNRQDAKPHTFKPCGIVAALKLGELRG